MRTGTNATRPTRLVTTTKQHSVERQIVLSPDTVWCWRARVVPASALADWQPTHLFRKIIPGRREAGVSQAKIDTMLIENPHRFFATELARA